MKLRSPTCVKQLKKNYNTVTCMLQVAAVIAMSKNTITKVVAAVVKKKTSNSKKVVAAVVKKKTNNRKKVVAATINTNNMT